MNIVEKIMNYNPKLPDKNMKKEWAFAGKIPLASRSIVDKIEYWLIVNTPLHTRRMFFKWNKTILEACYDNIDLDVKD